MPEPSRVPPWSPDTRRRGTADRLDGAPNAAALTPPRGHQ